MDDQPELLGALSRFARDLAGGFTISDALHGLTERITEVLGLGGAGVSLRDGDRMVFVTAVDERTATLERAQERAQVGPCVDACRLGESVTVEDLEAGDRGWGEYARVAGETGFRAAAGVPLLAGARCIGALDLYSDSPRQWHPGELEVAGVLADIAASYVAHASALEQERRTNEQLQEALDSRIVIEQAKGVLAAAHGISVDEAFALLRAHARSHKATLREVAEAVVKLGLRLR